jgi:hypothetical protein
MTPPLSSCCGKTIYLLSIEGEKVLACSKCNYPCKISLAPEAPARETEWEREFDRRFTILGDFGEKKFSHFIVTNFKRTDPIIPNEDELCVALKSFIRDLLSARDAEWERKVEGLRKWADEATDFQRMNIAVYNDALDDILALLKK